MTRKTYTKEFIFKVALAAISGKQTVAEIMSDFGVAKSLVHKWKNELLANGPELFDRKRSKNTPDVNIEHLHATIGRLQVEKDFLQKAYEKIK